MKKTILKSLSIFALSVLCFGFTAKTTTNPDKITICHIPPGNPGNCQEITISVKALDTHIDHHGDQLICHDQQEIHFYKLVSLKTGLNLITAF